MNSNTGTVHIERHNAIQIDHKNVVVVQSEEFHNIKYLAIKHDRHAATLVHLRDGAHVTVLIYDEWDIAEVDRDNRSVNISHKRGVN